MDMELDLRTILRTGWHRKWYFLLPASLVMAAAIAALLIVPPLYRSQATLLIEQQDMPEDFVPSLVTEQIERRLDKITRDVLVTDNLVSIANRIGLYEEERDSLLNGEIAQRMRDRFELETLLTEFNDPRSGRRRQATLGFQVSFLDADPRKANQVTNELVSVYMSNNIAIRRDIAERTSSFLEDERLALDQEIARIEDELAEFVAENRELVPREAAFKRQLLNNTEQRLRSLENDFRMLRERESYLATQLALVDEFDTERAASGTPEGQLELLRAEFATARARYSPSHPDVRRLEREVESLDSVVSARAGSSRLTEREAALVAELATLRERYTEAHPDFQRVQRELETVRQADSESNVASGDASAMSRSSSYIRLSAQLNSVQTEITAVEDQLESLAQERITLQEQLAQAPAVEREYNRLQRQLDNALVDREALADKEATAKLSGALETTASGERLTLVQPSSLPTSPFSPNKKLILAIGLVLATGTGATTLLAAELLDRAIRSAAALTKITGDAPLASIPVITTARDLRRIWARRTGITVAATLVLGGGLVWIHHQLVPLDVLGYQVAHEAEQKLGIPLSSTGDGARTPSGSGAAQ